MSIEQAHITNETCPVFLIKHKTIAFAERPISTQGPMHASLEGPPD